MGGDPQRRNAVCAFCCGVCEQIECVFFACFACFADTGFPRKPLNLLTCSRYDSFVAKKIQIQLVGKTDQLNLNFFALSLQVRVILI